MLNDVQPLARQVHRGALQIDGIALQAGALQWPAPPLTPVTLQATLRSQQDGAPASATLKLNGQAGMDGATLKLDLDDLDLASLAPYLGPYCSPD